MVYLTPFKHANQHLCTARWLVLGVLENVFMLHYLETELSF